MVGSTPTHTFTLPFGTDILRNFKITYGQDDKILITKYLANCECDGCTVKLRLSQEETFLFDSDKAVQIQMRVVTLGGDVIPSKVKLVEVDKCLDREVL